MISHFILLSQQSHSYWTTRFCKLKCMKKTLQILLLHTCMNTLARSRCLWIQHKMRFLPHSCFNRITPKKVCHVNKQTNKLKRTCIKVYLKFQVWNEPAFSQCVTVCVSVCVHMTCIILLYFGYRILLVFYFESGAAALRQTAGVPYLVSCKKYLPTPHPN